MWSSVYSLVEGAQDRDLVVDAEGADEAALGLARDLAGVSEVEGPFAWEVYVLPHSCDFRSGDECVCVQYLTDHRPAFTSDSWDAPDG